MGDWERTFGEGVSAEDVIGRFNESCESEQADDSQSERLNLRASRTAYRGDPNTKASVRRKLEAIQRAGQFVASHFALSPGGGPLDHLIRSGETPHNFQKQYNIPPEILGIGDAIFADILYQNPSPSQIEWAMMWPFHLMGTIRPGADLSLVVPRFLASIGDNLARELSNETMLFGAAAAMKACRPALAVVRARARAVQVQEDLAIEASSLAWSAAGGPDVNEWGGRAELTAAFAAKAAEGTSESAVYAAWYAARLNFVTCSSHMYRDGWRPYVPLLLDLIRAAPEEELPVIDLNALFQPDSDPQRL